MSLVYGSEFEYLAIKLSFKLVSKKLRLQKTQRIRTYPYESVAVSLLVLISRFVILKKYKILKNFWSRLTVISISTKNNILCLAA